MSEEKEVKNEEVKKEDVKKESPKKKLNVVFRGQNSQNMKELPKGLKTAAGSTARSAGKTAGTGISGSERKPRPLPAGTKPVKPAEFGETPEEKETIDDKLAKREAKAAEQRAAEAEARAKARTQNSVMAGGPVIIKKAKKVEEALPAETEAEKTENTAEEKTAPAEKPETETKKADVKAEEKAAENDVQKASVAAAEKKRIQESMKSQVQQKEVEIT